VPVEQGLSGGLHIALLGPAHAVRTVATPVTSTQHVVPHTWIPLRCRALVPSKDAALRSRNDLQEPIFFQAVTLPGFFAALQLDADVTIPGLL
jgi:hypothetical protein